MLCFLTRRFPFFTSNDDTEALLEIAAIFGKRRMEKCAAMHSELRTHMGLAFIILGTQTKLHTIVSRPHLLDQLTKH